MKILPLMLVPAICWLSYSCQKCELIEQNIVYPPKNCSDTFYFNEMPSAMDTNFTFNSLAKPFLQPLNPIIKAGPLGSGYTLSGLRSNFAAYDSINGIYVFEFFDSNPTIGFYSNQTGTNVSVFNKFLEMFVSPAFYNGHLYAIAPETIGLDLQYSIVEVNPITGMDGIGLVGNQVTITGPAYAEYFSSASTKSGFIYFLNGTNLIEFNSNDNSTQYINLNSSSLYFYNGLEYDPNEDRLLCMKTSQDPNNVNTTTLVSIKVLPSGPQEKLVFDLASQLPSGHLTQINFDFYSTTFDPCDTTYYITELNTFNPLTTNFFEVVINSQKLTNTVVDGYWFGGAYVGDE